MQSVILFLILVSISVILAQIKPGEATGQINFIDTYLKRARREARKSEEACAKYGPGIQRKIFYSNYVQPGDYQHDVALGYSKNDKIEYGLCTGVLISEDYVLTLARCLNSSGPPSMIRAGTIDLLGEEDRVEPQDIKIEKLISHPSYNKFTRENEIALIKLGEPANFTKYVHPACLYTKKEVPTSMTATGWGRILETDDKFSDLLLTSPVIAVSMEKCNQIYGRHKQYLYDSQFCGTTNTDLCYTGSGSSAFTTKGNDSRATIVGLTSFGQGCGSTTPIVYTKVSSYLDWIESIVWS